MTKILCTVSTFSAVSSIPTCSSMICSTSRISYNDKQTSKAHQRLLYGDSLHQSSFDAHGHRCQRRRARSTSALQSQQYTQSIHLNQLHIPTVRHQVRSNLSPTHLPLQSLFPSPDLTSSNTSSTFSLVNSNVSLDIAVMACGTTLFPSSKNKTPSQSHLWSLSVYFFSCPHFPF